VRAHVGPELVPPTAHAASYPLTDILRGEVDDAADRDRGYRGPTGASPHCARTPHGGGQRDDRRRNQRLREEESLLAVEMKDTIVAAASRRSERAGSTVGDIFARWRETR
jgi:hypothetical protein